VVRGVSSLGVAHVVLLLLPRHGGVAVVQARALLTLGAVGVMWVDGVPRADGTQEALRQHRIRSRNPQIRRTHLLRHLGAPLRSWANGIKLMPLPLQVGIRKAASMGGEGVQTRARRLDGEVLGTTDGGRRVGGAARTQTRPRRLDGEVLGTTGGERRVGGTPRTQTKTRGPHWEVHGTAGGERVGGTTRTHPTPGEPPIQ
jgi:hypothetical protein